MGGQNGIWGMGDHLRPIGAHEMMMRIPLYFDSRNLIPAGTTSDHLVSNYDFLPTVLNLLNLGDRLPAKPKTPGRDLSPVLLGENLATDFEHAVSSTKWKQHEPFVLIAGSWSRVSRTDHMKMYDMQSDPMERFNMYGQPGTEIKRAELEK